MQKKQLTLAIQTILTLLVVEGLALFAASRFNPLDSPIEIRVPEVSAAQFIAVFIAATAALALLIRTIRRRLIFEFIFSLATAAGIWFLFSILTPSSALLFTIVTIAIRYFTPTVLVQNLVMIAGISGLATSLGAGTPWPSVALILAVLAVYDVIAVYGTHHMVTMFKGLLERGVILAIIIPERPRLLFKKLSAVNPEEGFFFLGTGDIALPTIFVVSALKVGAVPALGAAVGSVAGLLFTDLLFAWGHRRPMPALPPIALGTIVGFFAVKLFSSF